MYHNKILRNLENYKNKIFIFIIVSFLFVLHFHHTMRRELSVLRSDIIYDRSIISKRFPNKFTKKMNNGIGIKIATHLVAQQFPQCNYFAIRPVALGEYSNGVFRLSDNQILPFQSATGYEEQMEKDQRWPLKLLSLIPLQISELFLGQPVHNYTWGWVIYRGLINATAVSIAIFNKLQLATNLAQFFNTLQKIDTKDRARLDYYNFPRNNFLSVSNLACNVAITWEFFDFESYKHFCTLLFVDNKT